MSLSGKVKISPPTHPPLCGKTIYGYNALSSGTGSDERVSETLCPPDDSVWDKRWRGSTPNSRLPSRDLVTRESQSGSCQRGPRPQGAGPRRGLQREGKALARCPRTCAAEPVGWGGSLDSTPSTKGGGLFGPRDYAIIQAGAGSLVTPVTAQACGALCRMRTPALTLSSPTTRVCLSAAACSAG